MNAPKLEALAQSKTEPQHAHAAFTLADIGAHLAVLPDWHFKDGRLVKSFHFKNYYETIAFANVVASISHATDHHPALLLLHGRCEVSYHTHDVGHGAGGISNNDFICAARIETVHKLL